MKNYFAILGLGQDASLEEIKKAYKTLALQFHPDKNNDPGAEERFKEIGEAFENLTDPVKRSEYDTFRHRNVSHPCDLCYKRFEKVEDLTIHKNKYHTEMKNYFEILGLEQDASFEEIKKVYKTLAFQFHPDKNNDPVAEERFKEIGEAFENLTDPVKRSEYDKFRLRNVSHPFTLPSYLSRPFNCDLCYKRFDKVEDLTIHKEKYHPK